MLAYQRYTLSADGRTESVTYTPAAGYLHSDGVRYQTPEAFADELEHIVETRGEVRRTVGGAQFVGRIT